MINFLKRQIATVLLAIPLGLILNTAIFQPPSVSADCYYCEGPDKYNGGGYCLTTVFGSGGCGDSGDGSYCTTWGSLCLTS